MWLPVDEWLILIQQAWAIWSSCFWLLACQYISIGSSSFLEHCLWHVRLLLWLSWTVVNCCVVHALGRMCQTAVCGAYCSQFMILWILLMGFKLSVLHSYVESSSATTQRCICSPFLSSSGTCSSCPVLPYAQWFHKLSYAFELYISLWNFCCDMNWWFVEGTS